MQIVLRMAHLQGATQLVDITQAHIDGWNALMRWRRPSSHSAGGKGAPGST